MHRIVLDPQNALSIYSATYRVALKKREQERKAIDNKQKAVVVEPTLIEWASPVVLAQKKDGSML